MINTTIARVCPSLCTYCFLDKLSSNAMMQIMNDSDFDSSQSSRNNPTDDFAVWSLLHRWWENLPIDRPLGAITTSELYQLEGILKELLAPIDYGEHLLLHSFEYRLTWSPVGLGLRIGGCGRIKSMGHHERASIFVLPILECAFTSSSRMIALVQANKQDRHTFINYCHFS
jgi:hypothetical protein